MTFTVEQNPSYPNTLEPGHGQNTKKNGYSDDLHCIYCVYRMIPVNTLSTAMNVI